MKVDKTGRYEIQCSVINFQNKHQNKTIKTKYQKRTAGNIEQTSAGNVLEDY